MINKQYLINNKGIWFIDNKKNSKVFMPNNLLRSFNIKIKIRGLK